MILQKGLTIDTVLDEGRVEPFTIVRFGESFFSWNISFYPIKMCQITFVMFKVIFMQYFIILFKYLFIHFSSMETHGRWYDRLN